MSTSTHPSKLGTKVLSTITRVYTNDALATSSVESAVKSMINDYWDPTKRTYNDFVYKFAQNASTLSTSTHPPSPSQLRTYWINLLPPHFSSVKEAHRKQQLQEPWLSAAYIPDFQLATEHEIKACNIRLPNKKKTDPTPHKTEEPSKKEESRTPASDKHRHLFPDDLPTSLILFHQNLRKLQQSGKTKADIIAMYADKFPHLGCFTCRFKQDHKSFHDVDKCVILEKILVTCLLI